MPMLDINFANLMMAKKYLLRIMPSRIGEVVDGDLVNPGLATWKPAQRWL
jgi:hypothetical protein